MPRLEVIAARLFEALADRPDDLDVFGVDAENRAGALAEFFQDFVHEAVVYRGQADIRALLAAEAHEELEAGHAELIHVSVDF